LLCSEIGSFKNDSTARGNFESPCGKSVEKTIRSSPMASMTCFTGSSSHSTDTKHCRLKYALGAIVSSRA